MTTRLAARPLAAIVSRVASIALRGRATALAVLVAALAFLAAPALAQTFTFTYQGQLFDAGQPANGVYDFQFTIYSEETFGTVASSTYCADDVQVTNGLFTVELPLVIPPTSINAYLNIGVRNGSVGTCASSAGFFNLTPRQKLRPAPSATYAAAIKEVAPPIPGAMRYSAEHHRVEFFTNGLWYPLATVDTANPIAIPHLQLYDTPGTYTFTVPTGVYSVVVRVIGGGGGGAPMSPGTLTLPTSCNVGAGAYSAGGGGGSGGAEVTFRINVTPGEQLTAVVGSGGLPGIGSAGSDGLPSRLRRFNNTVEVANAPGGTGGGWRTSSVTMGHQTTGCPCSCGNVGGVGGASVPAGTFTGEGTLMSATMGSFGFDGRGPVCFGTSFCPAQPGQGGAGVSYFMGSNGSAGGNGAGPTSTQQRGDHGKVAIWWD